MDIKVVFRLTEKNEREIMSNCMLSEAIEEQLPQLESNSAYIIANFNIHN